MTVDELRVRALELPDPGLCVPGGRVPEWSGAGGEDRLARQPRLNIADGIDHVTQVGRDWLNLF